MLTDDELRAILDRTLPVGVDPDSRRGRHLCGLITALEAAEPAPPMTTAQIDKVAVLLRGGGRNAA